VIAQSPLRGVRRRDRLPAQALAREGRRRGSRRTGTARLVLYGSRAPPACLAPRGRPGSASFCRSPIGRPPTRAVFGLSPPSLLRDDGGGSPSRCSRRTRISGPFSGPVVAGAGRAAGDLRRGCSSATRTSRRSAAGWAARRRRARCPGRKLHLIGSRVPGRDRGRPSAREGVEWQRRLESARSSAAAIDNARALLLPSMSEGLPRVAIESFTRGAGRDRLSRRWDPRHRPGRGERAC